MYDMEIRMDKSIEALIKSEVGEQQVHHVSITSYGITVTYYKGNELDFISFGYATLADWSMKHGGV